MCYTPFDIAVEIMVARLAYSGFTSCILSGFASAVTICNALAVKYVSRSPPLATHVIAPSSIPAAEASLTESLALPRTKISLTVSKRITASALYVGILKPLTGSPQLIPSLVMNSLLICTFARTSAVNPFSAASCSIAALSSSLTLFPNEYATTKSVALIVALLNATTSSTSFLSVDPSFTTVGVLSVYTRHYHHHTPHQRQMLFRHHHW